MNGKWLSFLNSRLLVFLFLLFVITNYNNRLNAQSVLGSFSFGGGSSARAFGVGVNPNTNRIYVTYNDQNYNYASVIDGTNNQVIHTFSPEVGTLVGINPVTNMIYLIKRAPVGGNVKEIDGTTNQIINIFSAGSGASGIGVNSSTNRIYTANSFPYNVSVIDGNKNLGNTNRVIATIPVDINPKGVGVNQNINRIYVANADSDSDNVSVIDGITNQVITTIPLGRNPYRIGVNPVTNRVYVSIYGDNNVSVIDGNTNQIITTIPVGIEPEKIGVNPTTNRIYVLCRGSVSIIDGINNQVVDTIGTGVSPSWVDVNPITNRIYVVFDDFNRFLVIEDPPTATLSSIVSDSALPGQSPTITLTGTNFTSGMTINVSGTGITVSNVTMNSSTSATATFTIDPNATPGVRTVSVTTSGGISNTVDFTINTDSPVAAFMSDTTTGTKPLTVNFTDQSTGSIDTWLWNFGDGNTSASQNPANTYTNAGTYTVSLTVTGPGGSNTETKTDFIAVNEPAPIAAFSATPTSGTFPLNVQFTDNSTGAINTWLWNFGDGNTSSQQNPSNTYSTAGIITVSLTVTGSGGSDTETKSNFITVTTPIPPPVAEFTATPTTGTIPLTINFSDQSTGNITSWAWDFGDGSTSTEQNPSHIYSTAGNFTVSLTVTGAGGSDTETKTAFITAIDPPPVAEFVSDKATGITPLTVSFIDQSTGNITSRSWNFGDGSASTQQNPSHIYSTAGTFTVSLTVTGPGGSDTETKPDFIIVHAPPVAQFSANETTGTAPLTVNFTDQSTGTINAWSWDFGDGSTSTLQNPSHIYNSAGSFNVSLTVTGPGGSNTETKTAFITVNEAPPVVAFISDKTTGTTPLTVNFIDQSTGNITSWSWNFGDGSTSTLQNPSQIYNAVGNYTVSLTATGPGGSNTETKVDFIIVSKANTPPTAKFSSDKTTGTEPLTVNFQDQSTGDVTQWLWNFGDGSTSTLQNPSQIYNVVGNYTVSLTATGRGGSNTETKVDFIIVSKANTPPIAKFSSDKTTGTEPLTVNFQDQSTGDVTQWLWDFGDESVSTEQNPSHIFNKVGNFTVSLTATGPGGSNTETKVGFIIVSEVNTPPTAKFSSDKTTGTVPLTVNFIDQSTGDVTQWVWDFGDRDNSSLQNPSHIFNTVGNFTVSLTVIGPGGSNTETKVDFIIVSRANTPPTAKFSSDKTTGTVPLTVNFIDQSTGDITQWLWDCGDGDTSSLRNPSHVYSSAGKCTVSLIVKGPGGSDTETKTNFITVNEPKPTIIDFSPESATTDDTVTINGTKLTGATAVSFGETPASRFTVNSDTEILAVVGAGSTGNVSIITSGGLATKSGFTFIKPVIAPIADFDAEPLGGFEPLEVQFVDKSAGSPISWQWDFGDGNISSEQNPINIYKTEGDFTVKLTVTNTAGSDTEVKLGLIAVDSIPPCSAAFNGDKTSGFEPLEVKFTDKSSGNPTGWSWEFGDGDISSEQDPTHIYQRSGIFSVKLTISAECGSDTIEQINLINVLSKDPPIAGFIANPTAGFAPLGVQFTNQTTGDPTNFAWKFGDGGISTEENPLHEYKTAGIFTPTLVASNEAGADIETKTNLINVQSGEPPTADFDATPLTGFAPLKVQFGDLSTGNITSWSWLLGDATTSNLQNPIHEYLSHGFYNVKLIVSGEDGTGVEEKINLINVLDGLEPTANFSAEPLLGNAPFTVSFFDLSSGDIDSHIWEFGDGGISTDQNPMHTYMTAGIFNLKLTVSNKDGTSAETKTNLIVVEDGIDPTAGFIIDEINIDEDENSNDDKDKNRKVKFKDLSSTPGDEITIREWVFGDGEKSDEKDPEHTFSGDVGDSFAVSLTVKNKDGLDTVTKPSFVSIKSSIIPGFLKGRVTDEVTKEVISEAIITINSMDKTVGSVKTTDDGLYFMQLPPGEYSLVAEKEGFNEFINEVKVNKSETAIVDIELEGGGDGGSSKAVTSLIVKPETAPKSFRKLTAIVTAVDEDGETVSGANITAEPNGSSVKVNPISKKTDEKGEAKFKFRFGFMSKAGVITFTANGISVVITQEE